MAVAVDPGGGVCTDAPLSNQTEGFIEEEQWVSNTHVHLKTRTTQIEPEPVAVSLTRIESSTNRSDGVTAGGLPPQRVPSTSLVNTPSPANMMTSSDGGGMMEVSSPQNHVPVTFPHPAPVTESQDFSTLGQGRETFGVSEGNENGGCVIKEETVGEGGEAGVGGERNTDLMDVCAETGEGEEKEGDVGAPPARREKRAQNVLAAGEFPSGDDRILVFSAVPAGAVGVATDPVKKKQSQAGLGIKGAGKKTKGNEGDSGRKPTTPGQRKRVVDVCAECPGCLAEMGKKGGRKLSESHSETNARRRLAPLQSGGGKGTKRAKLNDTMGVETNGTEQAVPGPPCQADLDQNAAPQPNPPHQAPHIPTPTNTQINPPDGNLGAGETQPQFPPTQTEQTDEAPPPTDRTEISAPITHPISVDHPDFVAQHLAQNPQLPAPAPPPQPKRQWELWKVQETSLFFDGLKAHGKDFDLVQVKVGTKTADQVRHYFYRTVRKLKSLIAKSECPLPSSNPEDDVHLLLCFWTLHRQLMRKKPDKQVFTVNYLPNFFKRLQELVQNGSTVFKRKNKEIIIKAPVQPPVVRDKRPHADTTKLCSRHALPPQPNGTAHAHTCGTHTTNTCAASAPHLPHKPAGTTGKGKGKGGMGGSQTQGSITGAGALGKQRPNSKTSGAGAKIPGLGPRVGGGIVKKKGGVKAGQITPTRTENMGDFLSHDGLPRSLAKRFSIEQLAVLQSIPFDWLDSFVQCKKQWLAKNGTHSAIRSHGNSQGDMMSLPPPPHPQTPAVFSAAEISNLQSQSHAEPADQLAIASQPHVPMTPPVAQTAENEGVSSLDVSGMKRENSVTGTGDEGREMANSSGEQKETGQTTHGKTRTGARFTAAPLPPPPPHGKDTKSTDRPKGIDRENSANLAAGEGSGEAAPATETDAGLPREGLSKKVDTGTGEEGGEEPVEYMDTSPEAPQTHHQPEEDSPISVGTEYFAPPPPAITPQTQSQVAKSESQQRVARGAGGGTPPGVKFPTGSQMHSWQSDVKNPSQTANVPPTQANLHLNQHAAAVPTKGGSSEGGDTHQTTDAKIQTHASAGTNTQAPVPTSERPRKRHKYGYGPHSQWQPEGGLLWAPPYTGTPSTHSSHTNAGAGNAVDGSRDGSDPQSMGMYGYGWHPHHPMIAAYPYSQPMHTVGPNGEQMSVYYPGYTPHWGVHMPSGQKPMGMQQQQPLGMQQPPQQPMGMQQGPQQPMGMQQGPQQPMGMHPPQQQPMGMPQVPQPVGMQQQPMSIQQPQQQPMGVQQSQQQPIGMQQPLQQPMGMPQGSQQPMSMQQQPQQPMGMQQGPQQQQPMGMQQPPPQPMGMQQPPPQPMGMQQSHEAQAKYLEQQQQHLQLQQQYVQQQQLQLQQQMMQQTYQQQQQQQQQTQQAQAQAQAPSQKPAAKTNTQQQQQQQQAHGKQGGQGGSKPNSGVQTGGKAQAKPKPTKQQSWKPLGNEQTLTQPAWPAQQQQQQQQPAPASSGPHVTTAHPPTTTSATPHLSQLPSLSNPAPPPQNSATMQPPLTQQPPPKGHPHQTPPQATSQSGAQGGTGAVATGQGQGGSNTTVVAEKLVLVLGPHTPQDEEAVKALKHNPRVRLVVPRTKSIARIITHLQDKWKEVVAMHAGVPQSQIKLRFYPPSDSALNPNLSLQAVTGWAADGATPTAEECFLLLGSPARFELEYGWPSLSLKQSVTVGGGLSSVSVFSSVGMVGGPNATTTGAGLMGQGLYQPAKGAAVEMNGKLPSLPQTVGGFGPMGQPQSGQGSFISGPTQPGQQYPSAQMYQQQPGTVSLIQVENAVQKPRKQAKKPKKPQDPAKVSPAGALDPKKPPQKPKKSHSAGKNPVSSSDGGGGNRKKPEKSTTKDPHGLLGKVQPPTAPVWQLSLSPLRPITEPDLRLPGAVIGGASLPDFMLPFAALADAHATDLHLSPSPAGGANATQMANDSPLAVPLDAWAPTPLDALPSQPQSGSNQPEPDRSTPTRSQPLPTYTSAHLHIEKQTPNTTTTTTLGKVESATNVSDNVHTHAYKGVLLDGEGEDSDGSEDPSGKEEVDFDFDVLEDGFDFDFGDMEVVESTSSPTPTTTANLNGLGGGVGTNGVGDMKGYGEKEKGKGARSGLNGNEKHEKQWFDLHSDSSDFLLGHEHLHTEDDHLLSGGATVAFSPAGE